MPDDDDEKERERQELESCTRGATVLRALPSIPKDVFLKWNQNVNRKHKCKSRAILTCLRNTRINSSNDDAHFTCITSTFDQTMQVMPGLSLYTPYSIPILFYSVQILGRHWLTEIPLLRQMFAFVVALNTFMATHKMVFVVIIVVVVAVVVIRTRELLRKRCVLSVIHLQICAMKIPTQISHKVICFTAIFIAVNVFIVFLFDSIWNCYKNENAICGCFGKGMTWKKAMDWNRNRIQIKCLSKLLAMWMISTEFKHSNSWNHQMRIQNEDDQNKSGSYLKNGAYMSIR